ncbi:MAG: hypothetical protein OIF35_07945 [Cellvibrionaceae bacterium]|nr:hypothetical protein [Cellvibrionaceae bacterium]MCV6627162.1 hypothetical protein [Cellvibrionaceae bacterium]
MGSYDSSWDIQEKELEITPQQEAHYPMLVRMRQDFDFKIVQLTQSSFYLRTRSYLGDPEQEVSPVVESLEALELHVGNNMVDILYNYLFEIPGEQVPSSDSPDVQALA